MSPSFVALAVGSAIEATTSERRDVSWRAITEVTVTGYGTVKLEDAGIAVGGTPDADDWSRSRAVRAIGALLNNPWQTAHIEKVNTSSRFDSRATPLGCAASMRSPTPSTPVSPRAPASSRSLRGARRAKSHRGAHPPRTRRQGHRDRALARICRSPELPSPERFADLVANLPRQSYPIDSIVASIKLAEQGVAFHGQIASRLPPGALDVLRPATDTAAPEPFVSYLRASIPIHRLLEGKDRVRLHVRPVLR